jgi:glyoxylase-like metal-dependent hydrolase (beta-lactamase superfamily II)
MQKIVTKRSDIEVYLVSAGFYHADAGAAMGVLPYKLWHDKIETDENHCIKMDLHCLLIKTKKHNILVDTGIGEYLTDRLKKIYRPGDFTLVEEIASAGLTANDIDIVIFTHLHFDHAGGILSTDKEMIFPNARYIIQKSEWETATNPDILNSAAYSLKEHYSLISDKLILIDGVYEVDNEIFLEKIGGHCPGMQILRIEDESELIYFAGDAFPLKFHLNPTVTSAYDISRVDLCTTKEKIKNDLERTGGKLILSHDRVEPIIYFCSPQMSSAE